MPWNRAHPTVSCDTSVSDGKEPRKPVCAAFGFVCPTPRLIRRPNHPNAFLLGFKPKLMPKCFALPSGRAGDRGQGKVEQGLDRSIVGALIIGLGLGGTLYHTYSKQVPKPYSKCSSAYTIESYYRSHIEPFKDPF